MFSAFSTSTSNNNNNSSTTINPFNLTEFQKIGFGITLIGIFFNLFGILLFFDRGFIIIGNILFIFGIFLLIGLQATLNFFILNKRHLKGTISFIIGFLIIVYGYSIFGNLFELYGFYVLFYNFVPKIVSYLGNIPYIGRFFYSPKLPE
ncbi:hypothetical protein ABK040_012990 [Willaertia magna]